ncbi:MAG TPA: ATP-binding protein [Candidatus Saccharimonadales bacterium]|nr:ATP-binding protein [Candidatus Saccharimonadales bacterium]
MANKITLLREAHVDAEHRKAILFPLTVAIIMGFFQSALIDNYRSYKIIPLFITGLAIIAIIIAELFKRHASAAIRKFQYLALVLTSIVSLGFLLPLPSPYMVLMPIVGVLVYKEFGLRRMSYILLAMFAFVTLRYFQEYSYHDRQNFVNYLMTYVFTLTITYYVIIYLQLSRQELNALERSTSQVEANQQRVESLINNITDGVIAVDHLLRVNIYNAAALDILDVNINIRGKKLTELFNPINAEQQTVDVEELLSGTETPTINRDLRLKYKDGSISNLFVGINPIYLGYGRSANNGYTVILRDITREKSLEEERDEFISVVSHELRTPIAIAEGNIGNAEFVMDKTKDVAKIKPALKEAHTQVLFLADMINDLSTLSRAERGKLEVEVTGINVHDFMTELADAYKLEAKQKGLKLQLELDPKLELLKSSQLYVREVLQNFITNAIKYTEKGGITLAAEADPKGVRFSVTDTGIGISKADQERVFDKFFRSEDFRTRKANGTGLGLYVTMKLARLIHAEIDVTSELNKGSTFMIFIPNLES